MKNILLIIVLLAVVGGIWYLESGKVTPATSDNPGVDISLPVTPVVADKPAKPQIEKIKIPDPGADYPPAKEISTPDGFINTAPFKLADLIGKKVILVDFWTYSCINCQRTTPYLNAWYQKYKDNGLEIVGVHTPEFEFEKNYDNVKQAVANEQIKFPVVLDNDFSTWQAYGNRYWPRKYLINLQGRIVYDHIGEGAYDETEQEIQKQLGMIPGALVNPAEVAAPSGSISTETYFGSNRNDNFATGLKLVGNWGIQPEFATNKSVGDKIDFPYQAKSVYFVASADSPVEIEIKQDGRMVKTLTIKDAKIYTLIEHGQVEKHQLEITIKSPGLHAYTFTFG